MALRPSTGQPPEPVERQPAVVDSRLVDPSSLVRSVARGEHRGFAQNDHAALSKFQSDSLRPAGGGGGPGLVGREPVYGGFPEAEEGHAARRAREGLAGEGRDAVGAFGDGVIGQSAVLTREDQAAHGLIGFRRIVRPAVAHRHPEAGSEDLVGASERIVIGDQQEPASGLDPVPHRVGLLGSERRLSPLRERGRGSGSPGSRDHQNVCFSERGDREALLVGPDLEPGRAGELHERLVPAIARVDVVVRVVEKDANGSGGGVAGEEKGEEDESSHDSLYTWETSGSPARPGMNARAGGEGPRRLSWPGRRGRRRRSRLRGSRPRGSRG